MINVSRTDIILDPSYWVTLMCGESGPEVWWEQLTWDKCTSSCFHLSHLLFAFWKDAKTRISSEPVVKLPQKLFSLQARLYRIHTWFLHACGCGCRQKAMVPLRVKHNAAALSHVHIFTCTLAGFMLQYPWKSIGLLHLSCLFSIMQAQTTSLL